jgi:hypothetical protein
LYFLAINYGCYEGWKLDEYESMEKIIEVLKSGSTYGCQFKILKELEINIKDE